MSNFLEFSDLISNESEFIPLLTEEDEEQMNTEQVPDSLPVLPLRNTVLFPGVVVPITVGRDKSIQLIKDSYNTGNKTIAVVAQKDVKIEEPEFDDLHKTGTQAYILKLLTMPDGNTTAIIQGKRRIKLEEMISNEPYYISTITPILEDRSQINDKNFKALLESVKDLSIQIIKLSPNLPSEAAFALKNIESPSFLVNFIASNLNIEVEEKQKLLKIDSIQVRTQNILSILTKELQMLELKNKIQSKVKTDLDKQQRDYILNQQLRTIQEELGDVPNDTEIKDLDEKAKTKKWSKEVADTFSKELKKLKRMNHQAAEFSIQLNYLETLIELPWNEYTKDKLDLNHAEKILNQDHYGMEKIKERIIEYLAVIRLKGDLKSPILCLVGPPGVGKTSLGKSIARALNRKYIRMSLGGLRDESELRGHRKTYIGALPGRIIQNLKKAKSANPVFVLDEIDKVSGNNISGDPQAALLEILDPEQNSNFHDNYLEVDFDLSKIMFVATANTLSTIHPALRDRMEIIDLSGYLLEEKIEIAKKHLVPKQLKEHGVKPKQISFTKKVLEKIIDDYTRESGVRGLEKNIAKVIRNRVKYLVTEADYNKSITREDIIDILGRARFQRDRDLNNDVAGVVTGLAWTQVGGEILFIESSLSKGKGQLSLTGNLGEVMKESATISFEYLKAHAARFNIDPELFQQFNPHIHIPEGATPKDGPSAGITMITALVSLFTQRKLKNNIAMTGEITLRGKVLPVGGIKEKILAAKRAKVKEILLSEANRKDIEEINEKYIEGLKFSYFDNMLELVDYALLKEKVKNPLDLSFVKNGK
ncbi:MAG: endopeptidase La [Bacteroidales bacterium]|jgi:ATP-dependent Lon protease|nr:endopeptidase La [Bacteroidales bacterium]